MNTSLFGDISRVLRNILLEDYAIFCISIVPYPPFIFYESKHKVERKGGKKILKSSENLAPFISEIISGCNFVIKKIWENQSHWSKQMQHKLLWHRAWCVVREFVSEKTKRWVIGFSVEIIVKITESNIYKKSLSIDRNIHGYNIDWMDSCNSLQ